MRRGIIAIVAGLSLAGCAGLQSGDTASAERLLTTAGFQPQPADMYADPKGCTCLYLGGEEQYRALRRNEATAIDRFFAVEGSGDTVDWGLWEVGPR